jgi:nitroreductase
MDVFNAMYTRRSQGKIKPDQLPRALIEQILSAAVQAPNHYKVRPWRFVVLTGSGREALGNKMAAMFKEKFPDATQDALEKERQKPMRAPVVIVVAVDKPTEARVDEIENICAVSAACQNMLLAVTALGLAAVWRTGDTARDPEIKQFFGFLPDQHLIGFMYIGYPDVVLADAPERPSFDDRTIWME